MATAEVGQEQGLGLGDIMAILRRRRGWFAIPTAVGVLAALILAFALPTEYEAEATIVNESQGVPDDIVKPTVVAKTESRWNQLRIQILARDKLIQVIEDFNLFEGDKSPSEEKVERMRDRITIEPLPPAIVDPRDPVRLDAFRIAFRWPNRGESAAVANRLTRDFISENLKERTRTSEQVSDFVNQSLAARRAQLADIAQQITDYKENFQGELPEQEQLNRDRLERARVSLADNEAKLQGAREQVSYLRRQMDQMRRSAKSVDDDPVAAKEKLELSLNLLLAGGKTDKHPDVARTRAEIAGLEDAIANRDAGKNAPVSRDEVWMLKELRDYEINAQVLAGEIERNKADVAEYEQRLENTPRRAAELEQLESNLMNLNDAIRDLQKKGVEAELAREIEISNQGERFQIVESAKEPEYPVSPNRPLILIAGLALGLLTGLGLLVLREASDSSFHTVTDLQRTLGIPVLGAIPRIELAAERTDRLRFLRRFARAGAILLALGTVGQVAMPHADVEAGPLPAAPLERDADV